MDKLDEILKRSLATRQDLKRQVSDTDGIIAEALVMGNWDQNNRPDHDQMVDIVTHDDQLLGHVRFSRRIDNAWVIRETTKAKNGLWLYDKDVRAWRPTA